MRINANLLACMTIAFAMNAPMLFSQEKNEMEKENRIARPQDYKLRPSIRHARKQIDDLMWWQRLGDLAYVDKVRLTSTPRWKPQYPDDPFAGNKMQFYCYVFIPKEIDESSKYPLIVLPHSGVHANFSTYYAHIVREFVAQGYVVVSAEYRGSTGYGKIFTKASITVAAKTTMCSKVATT